MATIAWNTLTDQVVSGPGAWWGGVVHETLAIDLEPVQGRLVNFGAVTRAPREVVEDRAVVRIGPRVPLIRFRMSSLCMGYTMAYLELDLATSLDLGGGLSRGSALVADDVAVSVAIGRDEAVVLVLREPADGVGLGALVVEPVRVGTFEVGTVGDDAGNVTVGGDGRDGSNGCEGSSGGAESVHLGMWLEGSKEQSGLVCRSCAGGQFEGRMNG